MRSGTINSNTFQDDDYKLGSLTHADERSGARRSPTTSSASTSWTQTGSRDLKVWLPDGTNYPGPGRPARPARTGSPTRCSQIYARLGDDQRLVLEYKFFEPAFYATDVPDWGTAYAALPGAGRAGGGVPRHRPPRAGHEHRVHRHAAAAARAGSARSTSTPASTPTTT